MRKLLLLAAVSGLVASLATGAQAKKRPLRPPAFATQGGGAQSHPGGGSNSK